MSGFIPRLRILTDQSLLFVAIGILGATVMPHNLFLHSAIVQTRDYPRTPAGVMRVQTRVLYGLLSCTLHEIQAQAIDRHLEGFRISTSQTLREQINTHDAQCRGQMTGVLFTEEYLLLEVCEYHGSLFEEVSGCESSAVKWVVVKVGLQMCDEIRSRI